MVNGEAISGGSMAIVVKLTRTIMLMFVAVAVIIVNMVRKGKNDAISNTEDSFKARIWKSIPFFVLGFLLMAILNTIFDFSGIRIGSLTLSTAISKSYKYLISVALVGIGYKIKIKDLFTKCARPVLLGGCTWLALALSTLVYVLLF